jgi:hypothetical protein
VKKVGRKGKNSLYPTYPIPKSFKRKKNKNLFEKSLVDSNL